MSTPHDETPHDQSHHDESQHDESEEEQTSTYKVTEKKTIDEYANLDANDESLNRWKASLGIGPGTGGPPKCIIQELFLTAPSRPQGNICLDLTDPQKVAAFKENPVNIKEGAEYSVGLRCLVENCLVTGLKYHHTISRGIATVKTEKHMIRSFGSDPKPQEYIFLTTQSPSGILARSGTYTVHSWMVDDDKQKHCDFRWSFKITKEW